MAAYAALVSLSRCTVLATNFSVNAEKKIRSIHEYVVFILSFLETFPDKANRWEGRIRDLAHDVEDIIQSFMWQQRQSQSQPRVELDEQLKDLPEAIGQIVGEMMEDRPAYSPPAVLSSSIPATTTNDAVIGLEDDVLEINERLYGHSSELEVVPIVGMAGIGKTTLARTIYDDPFILKHFDVRAWLTVSQDYSPHKLGGILSDIFDSLKLLTKQSIEDIDESDVATRIYQNLVGRRYLVVMDDVWSTKVWDDVMNIFPDNNNGSRIILTTRLTDLARYIGPRITLHEMRFMDADQSWNLLKGKVFGNGECPSELEDIGKHMASKCAGLPLAVVLVAGVLSAIIRTRASWEEIAINVNVVVERGLEKILTLSYTQLPHHLRPCFLLIGSFPEDESIHASRLVRLWVAEGFLKHEHGCSRSLKEEEAAEEYLEDLVKRNLVIVTSRKTDGKIKSCSLHDMVRDWCIGKAEDEKFLHVVDGRDLSHDVIFRSRRINFKRYNFNDIWCPTIRTVLCFQHQQSSNWKTCLQVSRLLRVLNVVGINHIEFPHPSHIFQLFHLTYLALTGSFNIPSAISNLVSLETLIIHPTIRRRSRNIREYENASHFSLPIEIWRMRQLRHLVLYDLYMLPHPPDGSDIPLENLQTLLHVENLVWNEKMVQMIPSVKKLGLVYTLDKEYHLCNLKYLLRLEKLLVASYGEFSWERKSPNFPRTLKKLTLVGGRFPWKDMSIIGSLPNLQVLKLRDNHGVTSKTWETSDVEFLELKYLLIDHSDLKEWITQSSPFPRLQHLVLRSCRYLEKIPEGIGEISTLELVEVVGHCRSSLLESVEKIKDDQRDSGNDSLQIRPINPFKIAGSRNNGIVLIAAAQLYRQYSFTEISLFTGHFNDNNLLDRGRGKMYRGFIDEGSVSVAIKRLTSKLNEGETEFAAKMERLIKVRHWNLASLIGYCSEDMERILVYEYIFNGTLTDHLEESSLTWNKRLKICIGAARGLEFLHSCSIIHHNVKPSNILLDESFTAKLSDYGLAQCLSQNEEEKLDVYLDPSYKDTGRFTMESDTYAFGVVLLKMLSWEPAAGKPFTSWALDSFRLERDYWRAWNLYNNVSEDCLMTFVGVAERCLHHEPTERPKMSEVVGQLELALQQERIEKRDKETS